MASVLRHLVLAVGLGGLMVEILSEIAMLRPPFDRATARRAVESLCQGRISHARRGLAPDGIVAVATILSALGHMALELPEIVEVDANPIRIANNMAIVADALIVTTSSE